MILCSFSSTSHSWETLLPAVPAKGDRIMAFVEDKVRTFFVHDLTWQVSPGAQPTVEIVVRHAKLAKDKK